MTESNVGSHSAIYAEEGFVVDVQSFLQELMEEKGISRSQLANAMGVTRARISQIFSDECKNLTVRLLARAVHALGEVPQVECQLTRQLASCRSDSARTRLIDSSNNVIAMWSGPPNWCLEAEDLDHSDTRLAGMVEHLVPQSRQRIAA